MKIYISTPADSKSKKIREHVDNLTIQLRKMGYEVVNPLDIYVEKDAKTSDLLSAGIRALMDCDTIFLCKDWQTSKACKAERAIAEIYGKRIKSEIVEMPERYWQEM